MSHTPTEITTSTEALHTTQTGPETAPGGAAGDVTALRSARPARNSEEMRRPKPGDLVLFDRVRGTLSGRTWHPARISFVEELTPPEPGRWIVYGWFVPDEDKKPVGQQECRGPGGWSWPAEDEGANTAPTRCTAPVEGSADGICGVVLGLNLACCVCVGGRCYRHCGGVEHFGGRELSKGGAGAVTWKLCEIAAGRFMGQIFERTSTGATVILMTAQGSTEAEVFDRLEHEMEERHGSQKRELPTLATLEQAAARLAASGRNPDGRAEILVEIIEWLRASDQTWREAYAQGRAEERTVILSCESLHRELVLDLFARLAGAL